MKFAYKILGVFAVASIGILAFARHEGATLTVGDTTVPTDFIVKNDRTYVPLADVAKAFKMQAVKSGAGYSLVAAGGANQVNGLAGKIGDKLNLGYGTYEFRELVRTKKYTKRFDSGEDDADAGKDIVAIIIRFKNGTSAPITVAPFGGDKTALTDNDSHSFQPFTGMGIDVPSRDPQVLPGAAVDFAVIFQVPESSTLQDLVYQSAFYGGKANWDKIMRISLAKP